MHRLLTSGSHSIRKLSPAPRATLDLKTCFITKRIFNVCQLCLRNQSTNTNPSPVKRKTRTRKKPNKNYYDLLVVSDQKMQQKKTNVTKLTWDDLRLLATTNLSLNELYKLKAPPVNESTAIIQQHTYNHQFDPEPVLSTINEQIDTKIDPEPSETLVPKPEQDTSDIDVVDSRVVTVDSTVPKRHTFEHDLLDIEPVKESPLLPDVGDYDADTSTTTHVKQTNSSEARDTVATRTLASYMEVCADIKNPQRALNAVNAHNFRAGRENFSPVKSHRVYNALLKGFGDKGDLCKVEEVLKMMRHDGVVANMQTYVTVFEAYGRADCRTNDTNFYLKPIRIHVKEALNQGFSFNDLMNHGMFANDGREMALRALRKYDPKYEPSYYPPSVGYDNHLVDRLNGQGRRGKLVEVVGKTKEGIFKASALKEAARKQLELEKSGIVVVKNIESNVKPSAETLRLRDSLASLYKEWESTAQKAFLRDLSALSAQRCALSYEPYMRCLPLADYVRIIVEEARKIAEGSETYSPTVAALHRDMGAKVYNRYRVLKKQKTGILDKVMAVHGAYSEAYARLHGEMDVVPGAEVTTNSRQIWQLAEHCLQREGATIKSTHQDWSPVVLQTVGKFLYRIVMHDLRVDVNAHRANSKHRNLLPAFYTIFRTQGRLVKEEVKPHPVLSRIYRLSQPPTLSFAVQEAPMLCPPVPWTGIDSGGYLVATADVVRLPQHCVVQRKRLRKAPERQLYPALDSLNQLGAVPWMVNKPILKLITEVFNNGGSSKLDVPESPSSLPPLPTAPSADMDKEQRYKLFRQKLQRRRKQAEMYSLWCDCLYRLSLANHYKDDVFWLPHNMDFRGRVYPIPPHLNHLGSDLARSMLIFAEGRPLGEKGLDWLKIHLINLTGLKKRDTIQERLEYANECLDDIMDSAERPLDGRRWWAESEEPWQTLACCMEIANVLKSPDACQYKCHFPVHQDGSCNGLQHYAALGRDQAGAYSVNLCESKVPQDVYSAVVSLVEEQRRKDAQGGLEVAKSLDGFIRRKVIKQTIMTTVYGVTRYGAREQISRQLRDIDDFPKDLVWSASAYLTGRTFDSLRTMFRSTREIQDWFSDCARLISAVSGKYVEWVTPMGLPVVQPYFKDRVMPRVSAIYKSFHLDEFDKPNVMKQKNAFPPNFIHSLDSSHMMLTSLYCERAGITFVSVHDCYWTHPSTVDIMNKICREQFVALHSEPILENLSSFLVEKYSYNNGDIKNDGSVPDMNRKKLNKILRQVPRKGDFDLNEVLESEYFFS